MILALRVTRSSLDLVTRHRPTKFTAGSSRSGTASSPRTARESPWTCQAGDRILSGKSSGSEVKIEDGEYVIIPEEDVFAILD